MKCLTFKRLRAILATVVLAIGVNFGISEITDNSKAGIFILPDAPRP